jgi:uncharacterized surface protein with fasciclin (FAS1) repeats
MKIRTLAAAAIASTLVFAACGDDADDNKPSATAPAEDAAAEEPAAEAPGDIVAVASGAGSFNTLVAAVSAAGLVETLQGDGPFTVFAPTDDAFAALPAGLVDALLLPENKPALVQILTYHVVAGQVLAADVAAGDVPTVQGEAIAVTTDGGVKLNGSANVVSTDVMASNGVIHVIDAVILPPSIDQAAIDALLGA